MKVVSIEQMREADRRTIASGTPGEVLMERAGARVVEFLEREFVPLSRRRVVVFCGTGNNGGDGLVVARLLATRVETLQVVRVTDPPVPFDKTANIVIDALLGTGAREPLTGRYAELVQAINHDFPRAKIVAVDIPSGMQVRADFTVTFGAVKAESALSPRADNAGKWIVADIGIPPEFLESTLELSEPSDFTALLQPRRRDSHKGDYGHVLVVGGAPGKTGAASMAGLAALRAGAGLVTVACSDPSRLAPELMTQSLDAVSLDRITVLAIGPGLGSAKPLVERLMNEVKNRATSAAKIPSVMDADALNSVAGTDFRGRGLETVLTPHPGEMARLIGHKVTDRLAEARAFAQDRNVCLVLKGFRTLIAFPDGRVWINPTGTPAMAKGGSGDILTGLIAGFLAQFPEQASLAVRASVWLHGRAGELAARDLTEQCVLATDLLRYLPGAIRECA